jgi:hypothetical protein
MLALANRRLVRESIGTVFESWWTLIKVPKSVTKTTGKGQGNDVAHLFLSAKRQEKDRKTTGKRQENDLKTGPF